MENQTSTAPSGGDYLLPFWEGTFIFYSLALLQLVFVHTCPIAYSYRVWVVWTSAKSPRNCDPHRTLRTSVWQFPAHWWSSWVSTFKQAAASSFWKHKSIMFQTLFCSIPSTFEKKQWWTVNLELNKRNNDTVSKIILIPNRSGIPTAAPFGPKCCIPPSPVTTTARPVLPRTRLATIPAHRP